MSETKTIKIGQKDVPLTKDGLPNLKYLSKEERDMVKEWKKNKDDERSQKKLEELTKLLDGLG